MRQAGTLPVDPASRPCASALSNCRRQHTASYPGVVLSGLVDLLALAVPLPSGTSQVHGGCAVQVAQLQFGTATCLPAC